MILPLDSTKPERVGDVNQRRNIRRVAVTYNPAWGVVHFATASVGSCEAYAARLPELRFLGVLGD